MPDQIFISYRRDDAAYVTGHINDILRKEFGNDAVFTDVDNIALGVDFRAVLDETVSQCQVLLAVIGSEWLTARDQDGQLRLQDPADFVRIEIESALRRGIPVIPLLVTGALMPTAEELPDSLRDLAYRNGMQIRPGPDFGVDVARLVKSLRRFFAMERSSDNASPEFEPDDSAAGNTEAAKNEFPGIRSEQKRGTAALRVEVDADERERHSAEIGQLRRKARRARITAIALFVAAIAAGGAWFFSGGQQDALEPAPLVAEPQINEPTQPVEQIDEPEVAATPASAVPPEVVAAEPDAIELTTAAEEIAEPDVLEEISVDALEMEQPGIEITEPAPPEPGVSEYIGEGVRLAAIGDHEAAIRSFDEALALNPEAPFVYKQRGSSYQALKDYDAAINDFDVVIRLDSADVNAYYRRGVSHLAQEDYAAAIDDFDAALELDPGFVDIYARRAEAHEALGNVEAAALDRAAISEPSGAP